MSVAALIEPDAWQDTDRTGFGASPKVDPRPGLKISASDAKSLDLVSSTESEKVQGMGTQSIPARALLGILLAELIDVPFETSADVLGVKPDRLVKIMHAEASIPKGKIERWESLTRTLTNLHAVLKPEATAKWLQSPSRALDGRTPLEVIKRNQLATLERVTRSYTDPSFT